MNPHRCFCRHICSQKLYISPWHLKQKLQLKQLAYLSTLGTSWGPQVYIAFSYSVFPSHELSMHGVPGSTRAAALRKPAAKEKANCFVYQYSSCLSVTATKAAASYLRGLSCNVGEEFDLHSVSVCWMSSLSTIIYGFHRGSVSRICIACPRCLNSPRE